ncbi:MAG: Ppx/GppA phosphatase family protein [Ignavibacteria bacterium]|nr:Ppx/GppA phosphatase family protein [Ignavibacteria bacterium]
MKNCIAAVDIGTNSFHLIIVQVRKGGAFKIIDREREVVRLGFYKGTDLNLISEVELEKAVDVLSQFNKIAKFYGADLRAIATSAVREAKNKDEFITRVYQATGIPVEAIDGTKEAELIYLGVLKALKIKRKRVLCIDIGGGSTEYLLGHNSQIIFVESIKVGAVRLSKKFFPNYYITSESIAECENFIADRILSKSNLHSHHQFDFAVGTSGTINAAASIIHFRRYNEFAKSLNNFSFDADELYELVEDVLKCQSLVDRLSIKGMEVKRADIIPAGLLILKKSLEIFDIKQVTVSENALREGIIIETIKKLDERFILSVSK